MSKEPETVADSEEPTSPDYESVRQADRYGFVSGDSRYVANSANSVWLENERTTKWLAMIGPALETSDWKRYLRRHPKRSKKRIRKGLPAALRPRVWMLMTGARRMMQESPGYYETMQSEGDADHAQAVETISRDIRRTFPKNILFAGGRSIGVAVLERVLGAYARHDSTVGYCQGLNFLTGLMLVAGVEEEEAFFLLIRMLQYPPTQMNRLFEPSMIGVIELMHVLNTLMSRHLPRLYAHFDRLGISADTVAMQWYITIFASSSFPAELAFRVMDMFLFEGWKAVHRVTLAIFKRVERELLRLDFEGVLTFFKTHEVDPEQVVKDSLKIRITQEQCQQLLVEHRAQQ